MRVLFSVGVALFAMHGKMAAALAKNLLRKDALGRMLRKSKPLVTKVNAFETKEKACCACFKSKYAWPANAALGAAFAPKQTCDTCYVMDVYGIDSKGAVVFDVPKPKDDAPPKPGCENICDASWMPHPGCNYKHIEAGTGKETVVSEMGPGACDRLLADPLFVQQMTGGAMPACEHSIIRDICRTSCKVNGCGESEGAYEQTSSKVEEVHEWNWNCASGKATEDAGSWLKGPVEGEPESTRAPFHMCKEDAGWYCPDEQGSDMKLEAGADTPMEVEDGSGAIAVGTMTLPVIDGAQSVAESVSDF